HSQGRAVVAGLPSETPVHDLKALQAAAPRTLDVAQLYRDFASLGLEYGPAYRAFRDISIGDGLVMARLALPDGVAAEEYGLHPSILDGALQAIMALADDAPAQGALPYSLKRVSVFGPTADA